MIEDHCLEPNVHTPSTEGSLYWFCLLDFCNKAFHSQTKINAKHIEMLFSYED